ncbi:hypothetical protein [Xanthomonas phage RTH11]|nr:hypothetical protein [Xanthomonas phage RTH11]
MSVLTYLRGVYARYFAQKKVKTWETDLQEFLTHHPDTFNIEGIELICSYTDQLNLRAFSLAERRTLKVYGFTSTFEELQTLLRTARSVVQAQDNVPKNFNLSEDRLAHRRFEDYFQTGQGHAVSIELAYGSYRTLVTRLISVLRELEAVNGNRRAYYDRKFRPLYRETFYVLQALYLSSKR